MSGCHRRVLDVVPPQFTRVQDFAWAACDPSSCRVLTSVVSSDAVNIALIRRIIRSPLMHYYGSISYTGSWIESRVSDGSSI